MREHVSPLYDTYRRTKNESEGAYAVPTGDHKDEPAYEKVDFATKL